MLRVDETLKQRARKAVKGLRDQLDHLNKILGDVPISETHKILPDFADALGKLRVELEYVMRARQWLETLPLAEELEELHNIVQILGGALACSENLEREK